MCDGTRIGDVSETESIRPPKEMRTGNAGFVSPCDSDCNHPLWYGVPNSLPVAAS